ncbi:hypothetical protein [Vibrio sp. 10N.239.312.D08]|uniref:hypothetical protein n=1 Tax=Vibrio sp. 10N.239.312.D08 TaxID=3229978 RepID=UPI003551FF5B
MFDSYNYEFIFVINPNGHFFVLEQEVHTHPYNKLSKEDLIKHGLFVFDSLESMLESASTSHDLPVQDLEGNEIVFKQIDGEWSETCRDHHWSVKDQIEDKELGELTFLQFLSQYEA